MKTISAKNTRGDFGNFIRKVEFALRTQGFR
jgi:hypothetical protein